MSFKDQMNNDAVNVFLNTAEFAETITYTPKGGTAKQITASVNRRRLDSTNQDAGRLLKDQLEISIANHPVYGVESVNKGGDTVLMPLVVGGPGVNFLVIDILKEDEGMWHLLLQK